MNVGKILSSIGKTGVGKYLDDVKSLSKTILTSNGAGEATEAAMKLTNKLSGAVLAFPLVVGAGSVAEEVNQYNDRRKMHKQMRIQQENLNKRNEQMDRERRRVRQMPTLTGENAIELFNNRNKSGNYYGGKHY